MDGFPRRVAEAREIIYDIMKAVSGISSLSVRQHVPGQSPAIVETDSFVCKTQRISVPSFNGLVISDPSEAIVLTMPYDMFESVSGLDEVDVMLTVWHIDSIPLPQPQGFSGTVREDFLSTTFSIEVRQAFSDAALHFGDLTTPLTASIVAAKTIDTSRDPATGRGLVFAPVLWYWPEFMWDVQGARQTAENVGAQGKMMITSELQYLQHLSIINKMAGCDLVPESLTVIDACHVCGGDNSTCSGCDGIPNSGRNRNCSGHGQCARDRCSCEAFYFGILCEIYCSDMSTCSGHGTCNSSSGIPCGCEPGWMTVADHKETGPYCTVASEEGLSNSITRVLQDFRLLIILIPSLVVCVCIACVVRAVKKERTRFRKGEDLMVDIGIDKQVVDVSEPEPQALDVSPPEDETQRDMVDLAPYNAQRCADLQEPRKGVILAVSEQAKLWPKATKDAQVTSYKRYESMLHHDKMPDKKLVKYLERGPRGPEAAAQNGQDNGGYMARAIPERADGQDQGGDKKSVPLPKSFRSRFAATKDESECLEEIAV